MDNKEKERIKKAMAKYEDDEFELYSAEAGWEEWMEEFVSEPDSDDIPESEIKDIVEVQYNLWMEVHKEVDEAEDEE